MNRKLTVIADTFLSTLPDPISRFKALKLSGQVVLLKRGTTLEICDYDCLENRATGKAGKYIFIRLAAPPKLTNHQNLCWFVEADCVEMEDRRPGKHVSKRSKQAGKGHSSTSRNLESANPMDSFCGLAVSPPLTAQDQYFPFGRIVYNSGQLTDRTGRSLEAMTELSQFFKDQKIQSPFGLHTDWLIVNRVSEIVSFLPADNDMGFQVLVASPLSARILLQGLANSGFADTPMFQGVKRADYNNLPGTYQKAEISVRTLLQDADFWEANSQYQRYMTDNVRILIAELDIDDRHLLSIPVLFHPPFKSGRTASYFPNMINSRLLKEGRLLAPQPKGPIINGRCAFETALECAMPSRKIIFTKAWYSWHQWQGEVPLWA